MTALILQAAPYAELAASKLQVIYQRLLRTLDDYAEAKMRHAVPEWQLRRAQRDIKRFERRLRPSPQSPARTTRATN